jgi:hypothetical protein
MKAYLCRARRPPLGALPKFPELRRSEDPRQRKPCGRLRQMPPLPRPFAGCLSSDEREVAGDRGLCNKPSSSFDCQYLQALVISGAIWQT